MGRVSVIVEALLAIFKGIFGTSKPKEEKVYEADQDADVDAALADPSRLPDPDKLRGDAGAGDAT
jgi:hypothetical protein